MNLDRSKLFEKALREVSGKTPRSIRLRSFTEGSDIWSVLILFSILIFGFLLLMTFLQAPYFSAKYGRPGQATVRNAWTFHDRGGLKYAIFVVYDYQGSTELGKITNFGPIPSDIYDGRQMAIHYLPGFLSSPALDEYPPSDTRGVYYLVAIYALIPFTMFLMLSRFSLLRNGKAYVGWVESPREARVEIDGKTYAVRMPAIKLSSKVYFERKKGDKIIVLVDPRDPRRNTVYLPTFNPFVPV